MWQQTLMAEVTFIHVLADLTDVFTFEEFSIHTHSCIDNRLKTRMQTFTSKLRTFLESEGCFGWPSKRFIFTWFLRSIWK